MIRRAKRGGKRPGVPLAPAATYVLDLWRSVYIVGAISQMQTRRPNKSPKLDHPGTSSRTDEVLSDAPPATYVLGGIWVALGWPVFLQVQPALDGQHIQTVNGGQRRVQRRNQWWRGPISGRRGFPVLYATFVLLHFL